MTHQPPGTQWPPPGRPRSPFPPPPGQPPPPTPLGQAPQSPPGFQYEPFTGTAQAQQSEEAQTGIRDTALRQLRRLDVPEQGLQNVSKDIMAGYQGAVSSGIRDAHEAARRANAGYDISRRGLDLQGALGFGDIDLRRELGQGSLDIQGRRIGLEETMRPQEFALQQELGRGGLGVQQDRLALERDLGERGMSIDEARQRLNEELGRGSLDLEGQQLLERIRQFDSTQSQQESQFGRQFGLEEQRLGQQQSQFEQGQEQQDRQFAQTVALDARRLEQEGQLATYAQDIVQRGQTMDFMQGAAQLAQQGDIASANIALQAGAQALQAQIANIQNMLQNRSIAAGVYGDELRTEMQRYATDAQSALQLAMTIPGADQYQLNLLQTLANIGMMG